VPLREHEALGRRQPRGLRHANGQVFCIDLPRLSSGFAHRAFKNFMPSTRTAESDQFVEDLILTVRGRRRVMV
jgi:hypothetical protein